MTENITPDDCEHPEPMLREAIAHLGDPTWAYCYRCAGAVCRDDDGESRKRFGRSLILMQGTPGSGKSTVAQMLKRAATFDGVVADTCRIISTDDYWDRGGIYAFEQGLLGQAHRWNQERCLKAMVEGIGLVIVDNTNIKREAVVPYVGLAEVFDYQVTVVRVDPGVDEAVRRNALRSADRQVPEEVVRKMRADMETLLPLV